MFYFSFYRTANAEADQLGEQQGQVPGPVPEALTEFPSHPQPLYWTNAGARGTALHSTPTLVNNGSKLI